MEEKKNKKTLRLLLLLLLIVCISIGYATLTRRLDVKGTASIENQTWSVKFDNIDTSSTGMGASGEGVTVTAPSVSTTTNEDDTLRFSVTMRSPGDYYTFKAGICNSGSVAATVTLTKTELGTVAEEWMNYTISGFDSSGSETVAANSCKNITIKIEYEPSKTELPSESTITNYLTNVAVEATLQAVQAE